MDKSLYLDPAINQFNTSYFQIAPLAACIQSGKLTLGITTGDVGEALGHPESLTWLQLRFLRAEKQKGNKPVLPETWSTKKGVPRK